MRLWTTKTCLPAVPLPMVLLDYRSEGRRRCLCGLIDALTQSWGERHFFFMDTLKLEWNLKGDLPPASCTCLFPVNSGAIAKVRRSSVERTKFVWVGGSFRKNRTLGFELMVFCSLKVEAWSANFCWIVSGEGGGFKWNEFCSFRWASANFCYGP